MLKLRFIKGKSPPERSKIGGREGVCSVVGKPDDEVMGECNEFPVPLGSHAHFSYF
jgi:hypothetical protein